MKTHTVHAHGTWSPTDSEPSNVNSQFSPEITTRATASSVAPKIVLIAPKVALNVALDEESKQVQYVYIYKHMHKPYSK